MPGFWNALKNTVTISLWKIALNILVPVCFTILLNEMGLQRVKKTVQTFIYLPHFVSWVLLAGIFAKLLSGNGLVNQMLGKLGIEPVHAHPHQPLEGIRLCHNRLSGSRVRRESGSV